LSAASSFACATATCIKTRIGSCLRWSDSAAPSTSYSRPIWWIHGTGKTTR
jgi:hypothetical protein